MREPAIYVAVGDRTYDSVSWSMGGILINGYDGTLSAGSLLTITAIGGERDDLTDVEVRSRVVRGDSGQLVVSFLDIDERAYNVLRSLMERKMQVLREG